MQVKYLVYNMDLCDLLLSRKPSKWLQTSRLGSKPTEVAGCKKAVKRVRNANQILVSGHEFFQQLLSRKGFSPGKVIYLQLEGGSSRKDPWYKSNTWFV